MKDELVELHAAYGNAQKEISDLKNHNDILIKRVKRLERRSGKLGMDLLKCKNELRNPGPDKDDWKNTIKRIGVVGMDKVKLTKSQADAIEERNLSSDDDVIDMETGEIITKEDRQLQSRQASNVRARNNLRRLITTNFNKNSKFLTLTFKENVKDIDVSNAVFKRFIFNLNRYLKRVNKKTLSYVAVIEFQDGERRDDKIGRGAIHYHLVCDLKGVGANTIRKYWLSATKELGGNIDIKNIRHVDNVGAYLVKYMTKGNADKRLIGKKLYQTSRGLKKPKRVRFSNVERKR